MKVRRWIYACCAIVLAVASLVFFRAEDSGHGNSGSPEMDEGHPDREEPERSGESADRTEQAATEGESRFVATPLTEPPETSGEIDYPKYKFLGSGTRGAIRGADGEVVWRATEESPVYSVALSPDDESIVVGAGDGNAYIITYKGEKILDLPQVPPGKDMLGLGNWKWIDQNHLIGESGVQRFDEKGRPVGCCQGHNVSESRFFIYDLDTEKMEEMELPKELRGKVVSIRKMLKSGEFLMGHEGDEFGWYRVADRDQKNPID